MFLLLTLVAASEVGAGGVRVWNKLILDSISIATRKIQSRVWGLQSLFTGFKAILLSWSKSLFFKGLRFKMTDAVKGNAIMILFTL